MLDSHIFPPKFWSYIPLLNLLSLLCTILISFPCRSRQVPLTPLVGSPPLLTQPLLYDPSSNSHTYPYSSPVRFRTLISYTRTMLFHLLYKFLRYYFLTFLLNRTVRYYNMIEVEPVLLLSNRKIHKWYTVRRINFYKMSVMKKIMSFTTMSQCPLLWIWFLNWFKYLKYLPPPPKLDVVSILW